MNDTNPVSPTSHQPSISKLLERHIEEYLGNLAVRNYSPQTIESQTKQFQYFHRFCGEQQVHKLDEVTRDAVGNYQIRLTWTRKVQRCEDDVLFVVGKKVHLEYVIATCQERLGQSRHD